MRKVLCGIVAAAFISFGYVGTANADPVGVPIVAVAVAPPSTCGTTTDSTSLLQFYLGIQPKGATVDLPANSCWNVDSSLTIQNLNGVTINAHGSTFRQTAPPPDTNFSPIVQLWNDTNITITGLSVVGAYDGTNPNEGNYGLLLEADNGVSLVGDSFSNIQGDFIYASPPYDVGTSDALNQNISVVFSSFTNGGYHGISLESVNGFTYNANTMTNVSIDAVDMEYDNDSSGINPDGSAYWAGQDNVTFENSVWNNLNGSDWFASIQGQAPGVQTQHIKLLNNTINDNAPFMEVVGTQNGVTTAPYLASDWVVENNHYGPGFVAQPYRGGSSAVSAILSVQQLNMQFNTIPVQGVYFTELDDSFNAIIANNHFTGALGTIQPEPYNLFNVGSFIISNGDPH